MKYTETQAKQCIDDRVSIVKSHWENKRAKWKEIYSLYRFWTSADAEVLRGERSNIFIPIAFSLIETKLPRLVQSLLSKDPFFKVSARTEKDEQNAEFMQNVMQFQLKDEINAFYIFTMWWKEALMYGNSYAFVGWEKEMAKVKERYPLDFGGEIIGYDYKMTEKIMYDSVIINHLDLFDCYPAPFGTRINGRRYDRMPYFVLRSRPTAEYLKSLASKKDQSGNAILDSAKVEDILKRFPQGYGDIENAERDRMGYNSLTETGNTDTFAPRYEMWTCFENDWWISKIGDTLVRNRENPFGDNKIPIIRAMDTPVPHESDAIGQIEPIIKLQYYANDMENMTLDWLFKSINPGSIINREAFLDPARFVQNPDRVHYVRGSTADVYRTVEKPNLNMGSASNEKLNLERLIDKVMGQSDISRGMSRAGADTATEVVSLIEQANFRFDLSVRLLQQESIIPLLDMMASRNLLLFPNEKEIKVYNEDGTSASMNVPMSRIIGDYRFEMLLNPSKGNKIAYAQTLIRFLDVVNASQGRNPELVREIGRYLEIENISEKIANPAEDAVKMIVQAAQEGLLANSEQAAMVLAKTLEVLAPKGSQMEKSISGSMPQAKNEQDVTRQIGQQMRL